MPVEARGLADTLDWAAAETELKVCATATDSGPDAIAATFAAFVEMLTRARYRRFEWFAANLYDTRFYPLAEHLVYGFKKSGIARRQAVLCLLEAIEDDVATYCDLGVGPGVILADVLSWRAGWVGYGMDISRSCLAYSLALLSARRVRPPEALLMGDIRSIPFAAGSVCVVTAVEVLEHTPDPANAVQEIVRVLRPGGYALLGIPIQVAVPTHLFTYRSRDDARTMIEAAGLNVVRDVYQPITRLSGDYLLLCSKGSRLHA